MPLIVSREKLLNIYKAELFYELHRASECVRLFEIKYGKTFEEFERELKSSPENFEAWDDYMEWKACVKTLNTLRKELQEMKDGNIKLS
ncbi:hypothetical protein [Thermovibrio sp.]